jgi:hypothetical protein
MGSSLNTAAGVFGSVMNACGSTVISGIISVLGGSDQRQLNLPDVLPQPRMLLPTIVVV